MLRRIISKHTNGHVSFCGECAKTLRWMNELGWLKLPFHAKELERRLKATAEAQGIEYRGLLKELMAYMRGAGASRSSE